MKNFGYGYVRVAAAKPIVEIAEPLKNVQNMLNLSQLATDNHVQALVFPELGITGYSCGDLFLQDELLRTAELAAKTYIEATKRVPIISIFGMPFRVDGQLFNVAVCCQMGKVLKIIVKKYIPNYKEFYEMRHFSPADRLLVKEVEFCGQTVPIGTDIVVMTNIPNFSFGIEICEDLWMPIPPSSHLVAQGATVIFNLSASNELVGKADYRRKLVENQSASGLCAYVYASCGFGESTSDVVWSGHLLIADNGSIVEENQELFAKENLLIADVDVQRLNRERRISGSFSQAVADEKSAYRRVNVEIPSLDLDAFEPLFPVDPYPFVPKDLATLDERCKSILQLQTVGVMKRLSTLEKILDRKVVIGISGGLDSLLALLVTVLAFDKLGWDRSGIIAVTMPGFGTSKRTKNNSIKLCRELGVTLKKIPIKKMTMQLLRDIKHDPCMNCLICENSQARIRTLILMSIGFVIGTGDLSELVLGWCTYNGDHMSMYNPNCGVPKTLVKFVVGWVAGSNMFSKVASKIIEDIFMTPISPELLPGQQTEAAIGKYDLNDFFIFHVLRNGFEPEKIHFLARYAFSGVYDVAYIKDQLVKFYRRMFAAQFKRNAVPDGIKIGSVAVSPRGDWRAPSDATGKLWIEKALEIEA